MSRRPRVLFVCLHGAAKSVVAAAYFRRLALAAGVDIDSASAGVEPDDDLPLTVVQGLKEDGFDVTGQRPSSLEAAGAQTADVVVSFGCAIEPGAEEGVLIRWDDIPHVSDGYEIARDAIVRRLHGLLADVKSAAARASCD